MAGTGPVVAHPMHDCTLLYRAGDWEALRTRLRLDGYLLLRSVLEEAAVAKVESQTSPCSQTCMNSDVCAALGWLHVLLTMLTMLGTKRTNVL